MEEIQAVVAIIGSIVAIAGTVYGFYERAKAGRVKEALEYMADATEVVEKEFKAMQPHLEMVLDAAQSEKLRRLASPKAIKDRMGKAPLPLKTRKVFERCVRAIGGGKP